MIGKQILIVPALMAGLNLAVGDDSASARSKTDVGSVVSKVESTAKSLKGYQCHVVASRTYGVNGARPAMKIDETIDVLFQRPNRFQITSKESNQPGTAEEISDGKNLYFSTPKIYTKRAIDKDAADFHWYHNDLLLLLLTGSFEKAFELPVKPKITLDPDQEWNGQTYKVIDMALGGGYPIDYKIFVGEDGVARRIIHNEAGDGRPFSEEFTMSDFQKNPSVDSAKFAFTPTADQKPVDESAYRKGEIPLITVGKEAAPFALPTPAGPRLSLQTALEGKKALLLNFWFVHCPPCRAEHPKLEKFFREFKDQGLGVLSVDDQDTATEVANYWKGAKLTFPTVLSGPMAAIDPKTGYVDYRGPKLPDYKSLVPYGVHECPTNILLNAQGEVVYVSNAWDEAGLRKALESLDIK